MRTMLIGGAAAAAIFAAGAALAAQTAPAAHPARHGGFAQPTTRAAVQTRTAAMFARLDTNHDNVLSRAEFDAVGQQLKARMEHASVARGGMAARMFDRADANKDGRVTLAEMQQAALAQFDRADLNHDGTITPE